MSTVEVTIIDRRISDGLKQEIAARLCDVLVTHDLGRTNGQRRRWRVIAEAVRPEAETGSRPDRRLSCLDFAAWHAHLSGSRRWVTDGVEGPSA